MAEKEKSRQDKKPALATVEARRAVVRQGDEGHKVRLTVGAEGKLTARALSKCVDEPVSLVEDGAGLSRAHLYAATGRVISVTCASRAEDPKKPVKVRAVIAGGAELEDAIGRRLIVERMQREIPVAPDEIDPKEEQA